MTSLSLLIPLSLTVGGGVLYHLAAKSVPTSIDPTLVLVVAYTTALCASIVAHVVTPAASEPVHIAPPWHPAIVAIGIGVVMIELGYLLTYRAAWPVSVAPLLTNGLVAALLVPIGMALFGERLSAARGLGMVLCMIGVVLLRR